jgi:hypothetical protein
VGNNTRQTAIAAAGIMLTSAFSAGFGNIITIAPAGSKTVPAADLWYRLQLQADYSLDIFVSLI